ncbi:hypothetical protein DR950_06525 [Kitasatospora xanthocidica]|uniref:Uncharacterized protein n=1 Tax=Kitasatospora xanthocidica TaxID=83382 RepID=A0A372ZNN1_9ACTN|nr:hypothetical protein [Kitasatospora xanthocidica]RGD57498.1 hypothetical protein DR950_06525 [Kitasatospora xanthocidica]
MLSDIGGLADRTLGEHLLFACLTGSTLDGAAPGRDIDVIAVLRDETPPAVAVGLRLGFSAEYARLHARFGLRPDLDWPGEVLFARDLAAGLAGAAFRRDTTGAIRPGPLDEPWRYWLSMVMAGTAVRGTAEHREQALHCAVALLRQQLSTVLPAGGETTGGRLFTAPGWWEEWRLPTGATPRGRLVLARLREAVGVLAEQGEIRTGAGRLAVSRSTVRGWGEALHTAATAPSLDAYQVQYCLAAAQAHREAAPQSYGKEHDPDEPSIGPS